MAGQAAVGVEVAVEGASLLPAAGRVGLRASLWRCWASRRSRSLGSGVVLFFVVQLDGSGGAVQIAPAVNGFVNPREGPLKDVSGQVAVYQGARSGGSSVSMPGTASPMCMGSALGHRFGQVVGQVWGEGKSWGFSMSSRSRMLLPELFACFSQPDGLQALHQFVAGQIECGGVDLAGEPCERSGSNTGHGATGWRNT